MGLNTEPNNFVILAQLPVLKMSGRRGLDAEGERGDIVPHEVMSELL
jgi:hypothetical protein